MRDNIRTFCGILLVVMGFVLLIALANVANLLLARACSRSKEIGVRLALGAGRYGVSRQLLVENVILTAPGGLLGVVLMLWSRDSMRLIVAASPTSSAAGIIDSSPDLRVYAFAAAASLLCGVVVGLAPALAVSRLNLVDVLKETPVSGAFARSRFRAVSVASQFALSLMLLVGAGLFLRTLGAIVEIEPGFDAERVLGVSLYLDETTYPEEKARSFYRETLLRVSGLPGVEAAALGHIVPLEGSRSSTAIRIPGIDSPPDRPGIIVDYRVVTSDYFRTLGIPILAGRTLGASTTGAVEVVINETAARRFWPEDEAVGESLQL